MSLEHAILGFLSEQPRSGYDLKTRCFDGPISGFWTADQAQIYRTLERLAQGKAVKSKTRRQSGRPDRRIYELTPIGQQVLERWVTASHELGPLRDPFLVQLWFTSQLEDGDLSQVLSAERVKHQRRLDLLRADAVALSRDEGVSGRTAVVRQMALDGAVASERAAIDWLDDALELVAKGLDSAGGSRRRRRASGR